MKCDQKWSLSTGKIVEDVIFSVGMTRQYEHSAHSFIFDLSDEELRREFTTEEIQKIAIIETLEKQVRKRLFDFHIDFELDWAQYSIQTAIRPFRANYFPLTNQTEADIIRCVWSFIDTAFDNVKLDTRTEKMESVASLSYPTIGTRND
ncbi:hypothetical protein DFQ29_008888 [Apophysomyces sp. BC1021]|nr:hypothetical protein DFQ29_008888 [Apophysomyces sp. BC1021]